MRPGFIVCATCGDVYRGDIPESTDGDAEIVPTGIAKCATCGSTSWLPLVDNYRH